MVKVREDLECECGCAVARDTCRGPHHRYDEDTCACRCDNAREAAACSGPGRAWSPHTCSCACDGATWRLCPTGYLYDGVTSCSCVPVHYRARSR